GPARHAPPNRARAPDVGFSGKRRHGVESIDATGTREVCPPPGLSRWRPDFALRNKAPMSGPAPADRASAEPFRGLRRDAVGGSGAGISESVVQNQRSTETS